MFAEFGNAYFVVSCYNEIQGLWLFRMRHNGKFLETSYVKIIKYLFRINQGFTCMTRNAYFHTAPNSSPTNLYSDRQFKATETL